MRTIMLGFAAAGLLVACSDDTATKPKKEAKADKLRAGEYEFTAKVESIRSTDNTTPATNMKVADGGEESEKVRVCVADDGRIDPMIFAEASDKCTPSESYMNRGRMSLQFNCMRAERGQLTQIVDGTFTADSFEAKVITSSYFAGAGDYAMTRTLTGNRVGDCPAAQPAGAQPGGAQPAAAQ